MPIPEESDLPHKAVLWEFVGHDRQGQPRVAAPVEIDCFWVNTNRRVLSADGNEVQITARVRVDREIPDGSILWRGELDDFENNGRQPLVRAEAVLEADDVKGQFTERQLMVSRFRGKLPTVAAS